MKTLRELATAATPGPWNRPDEFDDETGEPTGRLDLQIRGPYYEQKYLDEVNTVSDTVCVLGFSHHSRQQANAAYIVACSPDAILALLDERDALQADAARGRYMIENGCWHRGEEQTHLAVLVPQGSDLSCLATRRNAIDAAMWAKP